MTREEFEIIAGYKIRFNDYCNIIEPMYMSTMLDKRDFINCISRDRFELKSKKNLIKEMSKLASEIKKICMHYNDDAAIRKINYLCKDYMEYLFCCKDYCITYINLNGGIYPASVEFFDYTFETIEKNRFILKEIKRNH